MDYILFIVYLLIFCWLATKITFVKQAGLNNKSILLLFFIKVTAGVAIGWISLHIYGSGNDYWDVNRDGWKEYQLLLSDPREYFTNIFRSNYGTHYGGIFDSFQSFWNDLRNNIIAKIISIFDIFSRGNYYINSLFFNFFCFLGHVAFYCIFIQVYPKQKTAVIAGCFLLPSMLYFTSGIQKDGIVFISLGFLLYAVHRCLQQKNITIKRGLVIATGLVVLFFIRSYVLLSLLPALVLWILVARFQWAPVKSFIIGYCIAGVLLFNVNSIVPSFNPLQTIVSKQADFFTLPVASTQINTDTLHPDFKSFLHNAPQALNHLLLRPYPTELPTKSLLPSIIELMGYQVLFLLFLCCRRKSPSNSNDPFIVFGIFFTASIFLFIGYIMPNLGSIVRYRSVYLVFLITPLLCRVDWERLGKVLKLKK